MNFDDAVKFHGHACPGLAIGYRVANLALKELGLRARDEELVAMVENNSCAVDAIQLICGCTFGKGNLIFKDFGKQVYTFIKRPHPEAVRIAVNWEPPPEDPETEAMWQRYSEGDRSPEVTAVVQDRKARKMKSVLEAEERNCSRSKELRRKCRSRPGFIKVLPAPACGEKVMEPREQGWLTARRFVSPAARRKDNERFRGVKVSRGQGEKEKDIDLSDRWFGVWFFAKHQHQDFVKLQ